MRAKESEPVRERKTIEKQIITRHYIGDYAALYMFSWQITNDFDMVCVYKYFCKNALLISQTIKRSQPRETSRVFVCECVLR